MVTVATTILVVSGISGEVVHGRDDDEAVTQIWANGDDVDSAKWVVQDLLLAPARAGAAAYGDLAIGLPLRGDQVPCLRMVIGDLAILKLPPSATTSPFWPLCSRTEKK
uniref:Uncharacterized protein n=2 Tax=Oryza TaxID=4527 RepID=Q69TA1_ORYSJ|nr:hypothetical protein [Oryza sativa Japonica Group]BAD33223.1 hypothetical protein [Oryza sativa Japonica Group]